MALLQVSDVPASREDFRPHPEDIHQIIQLSGRQDDVVLIGHEADLLRTGEIIFNSLQTCLFNQILASEARVLRLEIGIEKLVEIILKGEPHARFEVFRE